MSRLLHQCGTRLLVLVSRPGRVKNAYVREDRILSHLPALHLLLTGAERGEGRQRRRTRRGIDVARSTSAEDVIGCLHEQQVTLSYAPAAGALHASAGLR
jgi:hypothetical protein